VNLTSLLDSIESTEVVSTPSDPFERIVGQPHAVTIVRSAVTQRRHVLLCGVPGIGKSMLAKAAFTLLQPPREEIRLRRNAQHPDRPEVIRITDEKREHILDSPSALDTIYFTPDRLPFEIGVKMGYRCQRCGSLSLPSQAKCIECGAHKRCDWSNDESYHGLFRLLDIVGEPALNYVTDLRVIDGKSYHVTYQRASENQIAVTRQLAEGMDAESGTASVEGTDRVLVAKNSTRFVRVSGSSPVELLGDVKHDPYGSAEALGLAAHMRVVPGAIHEAHEGILYIDEIAALGSYQAHLLTAMQDREYAISGHNPLSSGAAVRVDAVPCDFILFASCNTENIGNILPALRSRIKGYGYELMLSSHMDKTPENCDDVVRFIAQTVEEDGRIPHLSSDAAREVLSVAESLAYRFDGKRNKLTLRLRELGGLVRIAGDIAVQDGSELVQPEHVSRAEVLSRGIETSEVGTAVYGQTETSVSKDYYL
jgi:predicted ATP-dependent protease